MAWHMVQSYMEEDTSHVKRKQQRVLTVEGVAGAVYIRVVRIDHGREFKWQGTLRDLIKELEGDNAELQV